MPWAAAAAAAAAIGGAKMQADAADDASHAQTQATENATSENRRQFNISRSDIQPWMSSGKSALNSLGVGLGLPGSGQQAARQWAKEFYLPKIRQHMADTGQYLDPGWQPDDAMLDEWAKFAPPEIRNVEQSPGFGALTRKFTMEDLKSDPVMKASFDFGLSEGEKAVQRMFGARGMSRSGAAIKTATRFAGDYTNQKAGESYGRFTTDQNNLYNKLAGVSGTGQVATTTTAQLGANNASTIGGLLSAEGNARGAAAIAASSAYSGAASSIGNNAMGMYTLDRITTRPTTTTQQPAYTLDV